MRFVLLHYHIFKNAGSTIKEYLDRSFGECFERIDTPDPDGTVPESDILDVLNSRRYLQALSSHQFRYPMPAVPGILFFDICFLRDPLHRVRSTYSYLREKPVPGDPLSELVNRSSLGGFVADLLSNAPYRIANLQSNLLAHGAVRLETASEEWLDRATSRMLETSFLGVVDCFSRSIAAGHHLLRPLFPRLGSSAPDPANVSRALAVHAPGEPLALKKSCSEAVYRELVKRNNLDFELLKRARAEVARRFASIPFSTDRLSR